MKFTVERGFVDHPADKRGKGGPSHQGAKPTEAACPRGRAQGGVDQA